VVSPAGFVLARWRLTGFPDIEMVDALARLALWAKKGGAVLSLDELSTEMRELLELAGLAVEMEREAEGTEELRAEQREEAVDPGDPPA
jgi:hypothetical protein